MKHIIITGAHAAGKTTLVHRLLEQNTRPLYGFFTQKYAPRADGLAPVYLHPIGRERFYGEENLIGLADNRHFEAYIAPFETLGVLSLTPVKNGLAVMDELGFLEARAPRFRETVLHTLDGELPVLATVKAWQDIPFLDAVRQHPNVNVYDITPSNREAMYERLRDIILQWNGEV